MPAFLVPGAPLHVPALVPLALARSLFLAALTVGVGLRLAIRFLAGALLLAAPLRIGALPCFRVLVMSGQAPEYGPLGLFLNGSGVTTALRVLREDGRTLVTTNMVTSETYTLIRSRLGVRPALAFLDDIGGSQLIRRVRIPADWEIAAEELLAQYDDQDFSYVDATSFVAMRRLRVREAFAFDHPFVIAGFTLFGEKS